MPTTIYTRNLSGENFVEFRFDKANRNLYEISLVTIQDDTVLSDPLNKSIDTNEFYLCNIIEQSSILEDTLPIEIIRSNDSICINMLNKKSVDLKYFAIASNLYIGVNSKFYLLSIFLDKLSKKNIF